MDDYSVGLHQTPGAVAGLVEATKEVFRNLTDTFTSSAFPI